MRGLWAFGAAVALLAAVPDLASAASKAAPVDVLIRGGIVVDGTGAPARQADVAVSNGRIVAIGSNLDVRAKETLDATGLTVAPGFIDAHNHSDEDLALPDGRFNRRYLLQGVTTIVGGPDGEQGPRDIRRLLNAYKGHGIGTNVAFYVGHGAIRLEVLGDKQDHAPTPQELETMKARAREGMEMGAVGLSSGLMYTPGLFSDTDEVAAVASAVAPYQGLYETHVRDPHRQLLESDWEAIEIGRRAGIPVQLTHATTPGKDHRGIVRAVVDLVKASRARGVTVVTDQYPYNAVATIQLWGVLDYPESVKPNAAAVRAALRDPSVEAQIRQETLTGGSDGFSQYKASGPTSLLVLSCPGCEQYENKFISEIAEQKGVDGYRAIVDLLLNQPTDNIVISLGGFYEDDMRYMMKQPWTMIASDGVGDLDNSADRVFAAAHPRSTGTYPRVLGKYVREEKLLTLEDAVRKMTSAPADFLGLRGRGRLVEGAAADIVVFDANTIIDQSTWKEPYRLATGVRDVLVNGVYALRGGKVTGATPGQFLKKGVSEGESLSPAGRKPGRK